MGQNRRRGRHLIATNLSTKFHQNPFKAECFLHTRIKFSQSWTVSIRLSKLDYTGLISVDPRGKIYEMCYLACFCRNSCWLPYDTSITSSETVSQCKGHTTFPMLIFHKWCSDDVFRAWLDLYWSRYCKFPRECVGEKKVKIGRYLVKINGQEYGVPFLWLTAYRVN